MKVLYNCIPTTKVYLFKYYTTHKPQSLAAQFEKGIVLIGKTFIKLRKEKIKKLCAQFDTKKRIFQI